MLSRVARGVVQKVMPVGRMVRPVFLCAVFLAVVVVRLLQGVYCCDVGFMCRPPSALSLLRRVVMTNTILGKT